MANEIDKKLQTARTMEDIVNLLSILFTNLNNQNEMYYDMFLNPVPMDLNLERYNENGELVTVSLPNVAKMRVTTYSGAGSPNGSQVASIGALYIDINTMDLYYKASGNDSYGWQLIWTTTNLVANVDYISPEGDGSRLQNLSANSISSGVLPVSRGGTGVNSITGLIKGNGTYSLSAAIVNEDYLAPSSFIGLVMHCPVPEIPIGWLICDGTTYDVRIRPELTRLKNFLGNRYGGDGVNTFGVPDLIDKYIKGGDTEIVGTSAEGNVGEHTHRVTGYTDNDGAHTHTRGTMNITGYFGANINDGTQWDGAFYKKDSNNNGADGDNNDNNGHLGFDASRSWVGETSSTPHQHHIDIEVTSTGAGNNEVDRVILIPIIKY